MGVNLGWDNAEKTVIMAEMISPITWDELSDAWNRIAEMMQDMNHPVHVIVLATTTRFPSGNPLSNLREIVRREPENLGLAILVTDNRFQATINTILFSMSPRLSKSGHVVPTLEQAYTLIARETRPPE